MDVSERRACKTVGQPRMTQYYTPKRYEKDKAVTQQILKLAGKYPRYGYRFITEKLRQAGWHVNHKRVQRIWRKEGLQVPYRRKFKKAEGSSANSCSVRKAEYINHVWTYDFISDQTADGRPLKLLTLLDEFTRESLAIEISRSIKAKDVISVLEYMFVVRAVPRCIRSDNGSEFIADAIKKWLEENSVETLYIDPGSPWQNGYIESFHGRFRDEFLNREIFHSVKEARVLVEDWRLEYNNHRPHSGLRYKTPAGFAAGCIASASATPSPQQYMENNVDNSLIACGT
jgi:transposase InsO family protein